MVTQITHMNHYIMFIENEIKQQNVDVATSQSDIPCRSLTAVILALFPSACATGMGLHKLQCCCLKNIRQGDLGCHGVSRTPPRGKPPRNSPSAMGVWVRRLQTPTPAPGLKLCQRKLRMLFPHQNVNTSYLVIIGLWGHFYCHFYTFLYFPNSQEHYFITGEAFIYFKAIFLN